MTELYIFLAVLSEFVPAMLGVDPIGHAGAVFALIAIAYAIRGNKPKKP